MSVIEDVCKSIRDDVDAKLQTAIKSIGLTIDDVKQLANQGRTKVIRDKDSMTYYIDDIAVLTIDFDAKFILYNRH